MESVLSILRLVVAIAVAGGIVYGLYRGLRWRFPRLGRFRASLIVGLGAVVLVAIALNLLTVSGSQCLAHENTVLLRGERIINLRQTEERINRPVTDTRYLKVLESCEFLVEHCPLTASNETRVAAEEICRKAFAGQPLN